MPHPYQRARFQAIVKYAREHNPFYRRWIRDPENPPLLDRPVAVANNDEILNGHRVTGSTSGSIGMPFRYSQSREWRIRATRDISRFVMLLGGEVPSVRIVHTPSLRPGHPMDLPVTRPTDEQIDFILRHGRESGAVAILTLPTNAELLARAVLERGLDMSFIERFGTMAETVLPHHKELITAAFPNARLWDAYSSQECGFLAIMCPYEPDRYHIMAHRIGLEALREDGTPASPGEPGRVYITDFFNRNSPLIRYELGDLVERGECPCGRIRLPVITKIHGRIQGKLLHRDGSRTLFMKLSSALRNMPGMKQYKVVQDGVEEFTVRINSERRDDTAIRDAFEDYFGYVPKKLKLEYVDSIPRDPNGKYQTSICNA